MLRIVWAVIRTLVSAFRSRRDLLLENMVLRQQLAAFKARGKRPRIRSRRPRLLGAAPPTLGAVGRRVGVREAGHRRSVAPRRLPAVLELDLAPRRPTRTFARRCRSPRAHPRDGLRERLGRAADPRRALMLGFDVSERTISRYLRGSASSARGPAILAHLPLQPSRRDRGDGLLRGLHRELPAALRAVRHPARPTADRALQRDRAPYRRLGRAAAARGVPVRHGAETLSSSIATASSRPRSCVR